MDTLNFEKASNITRFIAAHNKARYQKEKMFTFQDREIVTDYAYYVIEHLVNLKKVEGSFSEDKIFKTTKVTL